MTTQLPTGKSLALRLLICLLGLFVVVAVICRYWDTNFVVFAVLAAGTAGFFLRKNRNWNDLVPFVVSAIVGSLAEGIIVHSGAWTYGNPSFAGIPLWLPLLWGLTGMLLTKLSGWCQPYLTQAVGQR